MFSFQVSNTSINDFMGSLSAKGFRFLESKKGRSTTRVTFEQVNPKNDATVKLIELGMHFEATIFGKILGNYLD